MGYSDLGDKFRNPILFADYSDPDVIRVGDTYYLTASSFNYTPGLPILVSKDLVNWKLVNYALKNIGQDRYKVPRHSAGVWAPSIRYHEGVFYIYYGMPDEGFYVVKTRDPLGEWDEPVCVLEGKGLIDSCPFWDEDGKAYIIHGYAKSRIGFKSILGLFEMSPDGLRAVSSDHFIFNGNDPEHPAITIEGPKVYKRNGYYYIWAPAGGVREGYQVVLRSKDIHGPYEIRTVMEQGDTVINGPHQGGLVDTEKGDEWFIHFQDRGLYGRICHLQPVTWQGDWPIVGKTLAPDALEAPVGENGSSFNLVGYPVYEWEKPGTSGKSEESSLEASDEFPAGKIGLQWQWMGDHRDDFAGTIADSGNGAEGKRTLDGLRLFCLNPSKDSEPVIWRSSNVLTQKLIYPVFEACVNMDAKGLKAGDRSGVCMTGGQYVAAYIQKDERDEYFIRAVESEGGDEDKKEIVTFNKPLAEFVEGLDISMEEAIKSLKWTLEFTGEVGPEKPVSSKELYFANVNEKGNVTLKVFLSIESEKAGNLNSNSNNMIDLGISYTPSDHTWVGAKLGLFALTGSADSGGYADFRHFIVKEL